MKLLYRLPDSNEILSLSEEESPNEVSFTDFEVKRTIAFSGNFKVITPEQALENHISSSGLSLPEYASQDQPHEEYIQSVGRIIKFLRENSIKKLVFSRLKFKALEDINISQTFLNLCEKYPNAFCWWFSHEGESWLGATPEILGRFDKKSHSFVTMSLAGTLPVEENWAEKETEEQKPVTDYISNILHRYSSNVMVSPVYDHISGNIKHLRNDFSAVIQPHQLQNLITELHPTPAVCGVPKEFCQNAIELFETHDRDLYSGYIKVEDENFITYFVNLRCAQLYRNGILLYAGGGITPLSNPEKEWRETELKMQAVALNLAI